MGACLVQQTVVWKAQDTLQGWDRGELNKTILAWCVGGSGSKDSFLRSSAALELRMG